MKTPASTWISLSASSVCDTCTLYIHLWAMGFLWLWNVYCGHIIILNTAQICLSVHMFVISAGRLPVALKPSRRHCGRWSLHISIKAEESQPALLMNSAEMSCIQTQDSDTSFHPSLLTNQKWVWSLGETVFLFYTLLCRSLQTAQDLKARHQQQSLHFAQQFTSNQIFYFPSQAAAISYFSSDLDGPRMGIHYFTTLCIFTLCFHRPHHPQHTPPHPV